MVQLTCQTMRKKLIGVLQQKFANAPFVLLGLAAKLDQDGLFACQSKMDTAWQTLTTKYNPTKTLLVVNICFDVCM